MEQTYHISSYCHIKNSSVFLNGKLLYASPIQEFSAFIKSAVQHLETAYPKFYKMDHLSKLAFLAADVLLKNANLSVETEHNIAIILSNKASSLDTDRTYQASITDPDNFFPSPSVFVYTLPNICMGEISIKHQLHSENCFFIFDRFNADHLWINAQSLLKRKKAEKVLCGWIDFDDKNYEAFLYLVAENGIIAHSPNDIKRLYKT
ncbi:3-oxoacyl-ACP synthase [Gelidibacter salicanalis]|uniref:3-oxoacyl-ACP synthase n=1 Tax=Gelidibacter salicanalis TaxID=291193 RepID=A0A934KRP4_9FLAO|nr:3-oxoacyl-ACP synthase [Gelidibacter salicanalis]MBJ7879552.1 3-oxoacyl-ACP synthase [Gelidibacter salicanalis]